jgi:hypothetical protein
MLKARLVQTFHKINFSRVKDLKASGNVTNTCIKTQDVSFSQVGTFSLSIAQVSRVSNIVRTFEKYIADRQHSAASSVHMHLDQKTVAVAKAGLQSPNKAWLHNRVRRVHVEFIYTMSDTYGYVG